MEHYLGYRIVNYVLQYHNGKAVEEAIDLLLKGIVIKD